MRRIDAFLQHNKTHIPPVDQPEDECYVSSIASISTFLVAIMVYRFGLWISDLSVTQILQAGSTHMSLYMDVHTVVGIKRRCLLVGGRWGTVQRHIGWSSKLPQFHFGNNQVSPCDCVAPWEYVRLPGHCFCVYHSCGSPVLHHLCHSKLEWDSVAEMWWSPELDIFNDVWFWWIWWHWWSFGGYTSVADRIALRLQLRCSFNPKLLN